MWGAQGWNQWALQPAMFNDVPHEQIDWAALAKQWIQMQQSQPPDPAAPPSLPPVHPPAPAATQPIIPPPPPPGHGPIVPEEFQPEPPVTAPLLKTPVVPGAMPEPFQTDRPFEAEPAGFMPKPASSTYWNKTQWEASAAGDIDERIWTGPPIEPASSLIAGKETYDYGHMHDNPPLTMQSIDYNHMSDFSYNQVYPPESQYDQYWSQVNAAPPITPMFLKKEHTSTPTSNSAPVEEDTAQIDAAKRKQLPAWIREGLEKMEQDRLKKIEKERAEKEKAEKLAQAKLKSDLDLKEDESSLVPVKSKFESDSDVEEMEEKPITLNKNDSIVKRSPSPIEDLRTEDEKRLDLMQRVRRLLTEILLSVTTTEMYSIAEEVIKKEKLKARQLASTASLTSVASGLRGLASYGTESEASEAEDDKNTSDSEEELYRRIREKKRLFAIKGEKILADLERKELEEQNEALKAKNENSKSVDDKALESEKYLKEYEKSNSREESKTLSLIPPADEMAEPVGSKIPFLNAESGISPVEANSKNISIKETKKPDSKDSHSSDSSSSSSESESESSEKHKKKSNKNDHEKKASDRSKSHKKEKSPSRKYHRRSRSSDSDSSDRHHKRSRSHDKSSRKSSSYKKKKKYKRSDSSSSSSSSTRKRKYSSKSEHGYNNSRERRSHSFDRNRKHRRSVSPKYYRSSRDSHRDRDSYSHRHEKDKYVKKSKDERYYDYKRSPSPYRRSSKLPKKYRSSRSLSSESESSGKKSKKSRNR